MATNASHTGDSTRNKSNLTGRDDLLIARALHDWIESKSLLPEKRRPVGDIEDMSYLLRVRYPGQTAAMRITDDLVEECAKLPADADEDARAAWLQETATMLNKRYARGGDA